MELISTKLFHNLDINKYFPDRNSCFIDIETTGLDRNKQIIYLIGLLYYDKSCNLWILNQYFSDAIEKEKSLLDIFINDVSSFDNLISYNGDRFDIPFINHRLALNGIDKSICHDNSYDLYKTIKFNKDYLQLENLKLKTVEKSLGYHREDIYSGFDCIGFYYSYIKTKDPIFKERLLKHNRDDLFYMLDIIKILDVIHFKKTISLVSNTDKLDFTIHDIKIDEDIMHINGYVDKDINENIKFFSNEYNISTDQYRNIQISININYGYVAKNKKSVYIDLLDYSEKNLISKSKYNIPSNIFILKVEKEFYIENIKLLLKAILEDIL